VRLPDQIMRIGTLAVQLLMVNPDTKRATLPQLRQGDPFDLERFG